MTIRPATDRDLAPLYKLYSGLFLEMSRLQPDFYRPASQVPELLLTAMESTNADILVACEGERVLGFAFVQEQETPPFPIFIPKKYTYLMDLAVDPRERGKGIGTALLNAVMDWNNRRGLNYIELGVLAENEAAARLYARMGFCDARKTMRWLP